MLETETNTSKPIEKLEDTMWEIYSKYCAQAPLKVDGFRKRVEAIKKQGDNYKYIEVQQLISEMETFQLAKIDEYLEKQQKEAKELLVKLGEKKEIIDHHQDNKYEQKAHALVLQVG